MQHGVLAIFVSAFRKRQYVLHATLVSPIEDRTERKPDPECCKHTD